MTFKTADLCDSYEDEVKVCKLQMNSYGKRKAFSGPISTVKVFEENVLVRRALETIQAGHVLVVDGAASPNCALLGDRLATIGAKRKLAGIIINGYVRDTAELATIDIGILALGSNPLRSKKLDQGVADIPVVFGSIEWNPGEIVYADEDGIIISKKELV